MKAFNLSNTRAQNRIAISVEAGNKNYGTLNIFKDVRMCVYEGTMYDCIILYELENFEDIVT